VPQNLTRDALNAASAPDFCDWGATAMGAKRPVASLPAVDQHILIARRPFAMAPTLQRAVLCRGGEPAGEDVWRNPQVGAEPIEARHASVGVPQNSVLPASPMRAKPLATGQRMRQFFFRDHCKPIVTVDIEMQVTL
jgi:hypothetical protein